MHDTEVSVPEFLTAPETSASIGNEKRYEAVSLSVFSLLTSQKNCVKKKNKKM